MNLRKLSAAVEKEVVSLFEELRSGMAAREDSSVRSYDRAQDIGQLAGYL